MVRLRAGRGRFCLAWKSLARSLRSRALMPELFSHLLVPGVYFDFTLP